MFNCLLKSGLRLWASYEVEAFEEIRPDALCGSCSGGATSRRTAPEILAVLCMQRSTAPDRYKCPVEGCSVGKGQACAHGVANCRGPHTAQSNLCPKVEGAGLFFSFVFSFFSLSGGDGKQEQGLPSSAKNC